MIYKKWIVHPDDLTKHPAYKSVDPKPDGKNGEDKERAEEAKASNAALSQTDGVGVYYLNKFRGVHNHPLDFNMLNPGN